MIAMIVACIYVLGGNMLLRQLTAARGFEAPSRLAIVAFFSAGALAYLITHELGHRIMGAAMYWKCVSFGFGPYEFVATRKGWKKQNVRMLLGAYVRQVPPSFERFRKEKMLTLLGGPMSSLIFGLLFAAITATASDATVFALFGRLSLCTFLGVLDLIPALRSGKGSDGYRLWQVFQGGPALDEMQRETLAEASNFTHLRYRDWPHALMVRLGARKDPYDIYLAYLHALDSGDTEGAATYIRRLTDDLPVEQPNPHFAYEAAFWLAIYGGEPERARRWMERGGKGVEPLTALRTEAAVALANGQRDRAETLAKEALALIGTPVACGSDEFELQRLGHILQLVAAPAVK